MLNGREIVEKGWITNIQPDSIQQHGVDLHVVRIERICGIGSIPKIGKTQIPPYEDVDLIGNLWTLSPGDYQVTFEEGCNIPEDHMMKIVQRSSLRRCGGIINSPLFDAGFHTDRIGTFMQVTTRLMIERGARIAQAYFHQCTPVENLYEGQFQDDKQRK